VRDNEKLLIAGLLVDDNFNRGAGWRRPAFYRRIAAVLELHRNFQGGG